MDLSPTENTVGIQRRPASDSCVASVASPGVYKTLHFNIEKPHLLAVPTIPATLPEKGQEVGRRNRLSPSPLPFLGVEHGKDGEPVALSILSGVRFLSAPDGQFSGTMGVGVQVPCPCPAKSGQVSQWREK